MYLHKERGGECFEDDDNDGLYHPNQQTREQERAGQEVHTVVTNFPSTMTQLQDQVMEGVIGNELS